MRSLSNLLAESLLVLTAGVALALAANLASPRGLALTRDYFPGTPRPPAPPAVPPGMVPPADAVTARLKEAGLQVATQDQVVRLFRDPRREQDLIVFVDATNEDHYQSGHIPGAYLFDHYHPNNYFSTVMAACQRAATIVVYCYGGDCEDSEFTARDLRDAGVAKDKLLVYPGGITDWMASKLPVELGPRNSGVLREGK